MNLFKKILIGVGITCTLTFVGLGGYAIYRSFINPTTNCVLIGCIPGKTCPGDPLNPNPELPTYSPDVDE